MVHLEITQIAISRWMGKLKNAMKCYSVIKRWTIRWITNNEVVELKMLEKMREVMKGMRNLLVVRWLLSLPHCCDGFWVFWMCQNLSEHLYFKYVPICVSIIYQQWYLKIQKTLHLPPPSLPSSSLPFLPFSDYTPLDEILWSPKMHPGVLALPTGVASTEKKHHCFSALVS